MQQPCLGLEIYFDTATFFASLHTISIKSDKCQDSDGLYLNFPVQHKNGQIHNFPSPVVCEELVKMDVWH